MKKVSVVLGIVFAVAALAAAPVAMAASAPAASDQPALVADSSGVSDSVLAIVAPLVVAGASLAANFTEVKPGEKWWVSLLKKTLNVFALNFSKKAGA